MAHSRKFFTAGAVGVAAIALIGTGAGAVYTDTLTSAQTISTGTLNFTVSGDGATSTGKRVEWVTPVGGFGSTFTTTHHVTVKNAGTLAPTKMTLTTFSGVEGTPVGMPQAQVDKQNAASNALKNAVTVTIDAYPGGSTTGAIYHYSGLLSGLPTSAPIDGTIPVGASIDAVVTYSANDLPNVTQGGSIASAFFIAFEG